VLVDPRHTSQMCSACGHVAPENRRRQAVFSCVACGHTDHADINAAKNIRARGLRVPARGGKPEVGAPSETRTTGMEAA
jgi:putative transposase